MAIRICQCITELRPAGAERLVYELATRLPAEGVAVEVVGLRGGAVADALAAAGVPVHVLGVRGKADLLRLPGLARLLRRGRFDLLHTHLFHADLAARPAGAAAGVSHIVHSVHVAERRWRPWQFAWARLADLWCDRIVCVSGDVRDFHARRTGLPRGRYEVIYNGIDAARYARDDARRAELRRQWGFTDADIVCIFVGRLDVQKGVADLLAAFALAARADARLRLVLAGDGPLRDFVRQRLAEGDLGSRVRALGFTQDVPGVLSAGDLFVLPSRWEGFGLAAAEAMAAGLAVVGTDIPGLREVVAAEQTGLLCRPGDVAGLAAAIGKLAADVDLRARLGQAGLARVREQFTIDRCVREHAALYRRLLGS